MATPTTGNDTLTGTTGNDTINGLAGNDSIDGGNGNDSLIGGDGNDTLMGGAGSDTLDGGIGDDLYYIDIATDVISETTSNAAGGGVDTIDTKISLDLSNTSLLNIDNARVNTAVSVFTAIKLTGNGLDNTLTGHGGVDTLIGGDGNDKLSGLAGNDSLDGGTGNDTLDGGTGKDTMAGGLGDDLYYVNVSSDVISETTTTAAGGGVDTIDTAITLDLNGTTLLNIDNARVNTGVATTTAIKLTGNGLDNTLTGHGGVDTLIGGAGNDKLSGLAGNDSLDGGTGNDTLDGGTGNDTMIGGIGDDLYYVDSGTDAISETTTTAAGGGVDTIDTTITLDLNGTTLLNIDNARVNAAVATATAIKLTGNGLDNTLTGHAGVDTLIGGAGNDKLFGLAGNDSLDGGVGNDLLDGGQGNDTMAGGADNDVYIVDSVSDVVNEASGTANGTFDEVKSSVTYSLNDTNSAGVEGLTLTGTDAISAKGNSLNNTLIGNSGANQLDGGLGNDSMTGYGGNDWYTVDNVNDLVTETNGAIDGAADKITSSISYALNNTNTSGVELLQLDGTNNINGTGNDLNNDLHGNSGANILDGGIGADTLMGLGGNDTYIVDNVNDKVFETNGAVDGANDVVETTVTYALSGLAAGVETLALKGTNAINGTGNALNNILTGNSADNTLDGGLGADVMSGDAGNDAYIVDNVADTVSDTAGTDDQIYASVNYSLVGTGVESLILTGSADIDAFGDTLDNYLEGNSGANALDGGAGADIMAGLDGDDRYIVDNAGDVVYEFNTTTSGLDDTVYASVSYALNNVSSKGVESLILTGTTDIDATGNDFGNYLEGNSGANALDGGKGADIMAGFDGNDSYIVDDAGDSVYEYTFANSGTDDTVYASVSYALNNGNSKGVESLILTGTTDIDATGNSLDNYLEGNDGANQLDGGAGADIMGGGNGNDSYIVDNENDLVYEFGGATGGLDTVYSTVSYTIDNAASKGVESLTLLGTDDIDATGNTADNGLDGNAGANVLSGGEGNDVINGFDGNDVLDGGVGDDAMAGGNGDDVYFVDSDYDTITEAAGEGTDTVYSTLSLYYMDDNIENLVLSGGVGSLAVGNVADNVIIGTDFNDTLVGVGGNDSLYGGYGDDLFVDSGANGAGNDLLAGGDGNDRYTFSGSFGANTIDEFDAAANADLVTFNALATNQLWFSHVAGTDDLQISVLGYTNSVTVSNWYAGDEFKVEQIKSVSGATRMALTTTGVEALVQAMSAFTPPASIASMSQADQNTINAAIAANWQTTT